jgi:hypothetical protein
MEMDEVGGPEVVGLAALLALQVSTLVDLLGAFQEGEQKEKGRAPRQMFVIGTEWSADVGGQSVVVVVDVVGASVAPAVVLATTLTEVAVVRSWTVVDSP